MAYEKTPPRKPWPKDRFELIPLAELRDYLERRRGKRLHRTAVYRWRLPGIHGVKLKCKLRGAGWWTCRAWLEDFEDATTAKAEELQQIASPR